MNSACGQQTVKLWETDPPTDNKLTERETSKEGRIFNVSEAELIIYQPDAESGNKKAVIICPGGGYMLLAIDHEGHQFAKWLQSKGFVAVILKYRMPNGHPAVPLEDFHEAMRYVRSHAVELGIVDEQMNIKIGVAGFSAGGHLASTASTQFPSADLRPDFSILFYPVISMGGYTHEGSRNNLLGHNTTANEILQYSNETRVSAQTPPTILLLSDDDTTVPSMNSIMYYEELKKHNIPATMYIFPEGEHGWGMKEGFKYHKQMLSLLSDWLDNLE